MGEEHYSIVKRGRRQGGQKNRMGRPRPSLQLSKGDDQHFLQHAGEEGDDWSEGSGDEGSEEFSGGEEEMDCPLCLEEMDESDGQFFPCPCGYQVTMKPFFTLDLIFKIDMSVLLA